MNVTILSHLNLILLRSTMGVMAALPGTAAMEEELQPLRSQQ